MNLKASDRSYTTLTATESLGQIKQFCSVSIVWIGAHGSDPAPEDTNICGKSRIRSDGGLNNTSSVPMNKTKCWTKWLTHTIRRPHILLMIPTNPIRNGITFLLFRSGGNTSAPLISILYMIINQMIETIIETNVKTNV